MTKPELKAEARRLRLEERLSYREISIRLGMAKSSFTSWLKDIPLTSEELTSKVSDVPHLRREEKYGRLGEDYLKSLVASSTSFQDIKRALGITTDSKNSQIKYYIALYGIDISHFTRSKITKSIKDTLGKSCTGCSMYKLYTEYYKSKGYYISQCKECSKARWNSDSRQRQKRDWALRKDYGISLEEYESMLELQNGVCLICGAPDRKLAVDHDHASGKVRGIICINCNTGIGMLGDSLEVLESALAYLKIFQ